MSSIDYVTCAICLGYILADQETRQHQPNGAHVSQAAQSALRQEPQQLPAPHVFHRPCFETWYRINPICPICRVAVDVFANPLQDPLQARQNDVEALTEASIEGNEARVLEILRSVELTPESRGWAAFCAAFRLNWGIADQILATGPINGFHQSLIDLCPRVAR
jgi:hypothetical protein